MRTTPWPLAALVVVSCGYPPLDPTPAEFGLDTRPSNPTCTAKQRPVINTGVRLQRQWTGITFDQPILLTQAPGDNDRWYVVQRSGTVRTFLQNATSDAQTRNFATVAINDAGEGGLLSMAFHPRWPARREAYLSYTRNRAGGDPAPVCSATVDHVFTSVVARYQSSDGTSLDQGPDEILEVGQPYSNHNGGHIEFGHDGMLYFGLGDGGSGNDPCGSGQNLGSLLGKVLRIDIDAPAGMYQVPPDNPFVGTSARPEIWAYGVRNPWRWSFDRATGDLWLGDVGQNVFEEIDRVVKGGNYGWSPCEGRHRRGNTTALCNMPGLIDPVVEHPRGEARSITAGYVYRGSAMPSLVGTFIYGDFETGNIWALTYNADNRPTPRVIATVAAGSLASFAQGHDGEIYTVQLTTGEVSKLVPAAPPQADDFPQLLSQTGCVDPGDPSKPVDGMIPYEINSPLWSDGADKRRHLAIPDGTTIAIDAQQDWVLPIGSVAMKTFVVDRKPVETRLFMRHDDGGWAGYTYEWNDSGSDAVLLPAGKVKQLGPSAAWAYPSRDQCIQCHSLAAGGTLGFETAQLNRTAVYPSTNRVSNQLATLEHIGMLAAPLAQPPAEAPRLPDPGGSDSPEVRARSYLHANCSHCHRPMGGGQGMLDLRYAQALGDTSTCNVDNTQGSVAGATKLLVPGSPQTSILSLRMYATDAKRMPPVAVSVTDPLGTMVVDEWIRSLTACP